MLLMATAMTALAAQAREIAITFDDAPRGDGRVFTGPERTTALLASLDEAGVEGAIFFAVGQQVDSPGERRLRAYSAAGHYLANHSHTHGSPERLGVEAYLEDVRQADHVLSPLPSYLRLYRFPFLNEGRDEATRDALRDGLVAQDLGQGYVTVDNYDWYMEYLLQQALSEGREVDYERLGALYVGLLSEAVEFYDRIAVETLGRSPRHVLLLHENDLAALFVDDLVRALRDAGWSIIPGPVAYEDALAGRVPDTLFLGQGRVAALAAEAGRPRPELVHEAEDEDWLEARFEAAGVFGPLPASDTGTSIPEAAGRP